MTLQAHLRERWMTSHRYLAQKAMKMDNLPRPSSRSQASYSSHWVTKEDREHKPCPIKIKDLVHSILAIVLTLKQRIKSQNRCKHLAFQIYLWRKPPVTKQTEALVAKWSPSLSINRSHPQTTSTQCWMSLALGAIKIKRKWILLPPSVSHQSNRKLGTKMTSCTRQDNPSPV